VDPAGLTWDLRVDEIERRMEPAVPVGGDQLQGIPDQPAAGERGKERLPRRLRLVADDPEIDQLPLSGGADTVRDENQAAFGLRDALDPQADRI